MTAHLNDASQLLALGREQEKSRIFRDHITSTPLAVQPKELRAVKASECFKSAEEGRSPPRS